METTPSVGYPRWFIETPPSGGSRRHLPKQGGGGAPSQEGWAPTTQGPMGHLLITLNALLTRPRSLIVEASNV